MALNLRMERVAARKGPVRALTFQCSAQWVGNKPAFLLGLDGVLLLGDRVLSEPVRVQQAQWPDGAQASLRPDRTMAIHLSAPMSNAALKFVEETRGQGDVILQLNVQYQWRDDEGVCWEGSAVQMRPVPRSDWLKLLQEMDWSEIEIFEVSKLPLLEHQYLAASLPLLRAAERALRDGNYREVLAKCREALESAAKYTSQSDNLKAGFAGLMEDSFPESKRKRELLDSFIVAFSAYAHLGRHAQFPELHISREEAEFVFTTSLGFFSMLSRNLAKPEGN